MFTAYAYQPASGKWKRQELPGPADFPAWRKSWMVLRTTFLLPKAVSPEQLDLYGEWIHSLHEAYGRERWWLIAQADIH
eukprot:11223840-Lingulodinium_polyedra.AAC.1